MNKNDRHRFAWLLIVIAAAVGLIVIGGAMYVWGAQRFRTSPLRVGATLASGSSPLVVMFAGAADKMHLLDFGDGTAPTGYMLAHECAPADHPEWNGNPAAFSEAHTYTRAGTYTATLQDDCHGQASVTITVR